MAFVIFLKQKLTFASITMRCDAEVTIGINQPAPVGFVDYIVCETQKRSQAPSGSAASSGEVVPEFLIVYDSVLQVFPKKGGSARRGPRDIVTTHQANSEKGLMHPALTL